MAGRRFIVEQRPVGHRQLPRRRIDRKPSPRRIRQAVRPRVSGVGIDRRDFAHDGPGPGILPHRVDRQRQVRRRFIHVRHLCADRLSIDSSGAIRHFDSHVINVIAAAVCRSFKVRRRDETELP